MRVELNYGQHGLEVDVPDEATVLLPRHVPGLADEQAALQAALRQPVGGPALRGRLKPDDQVVIVFSDLTRPMPNNRVLPALLHELDCLPREQILLINALGTHRPNTPAELTAMLGAEIVDNYRIIQHNAFDPEQLVEVGTSRFGHRALVNRHYHEATFKILTGFIEPHFFAGFSGGPKAVLPGVAGIESIMANHNYAMLSDPAATWGRTEGNPVWEEIRQVAAMTGPDFLLNVTLNRRREITGVFAGDVWQAHRQGVEFARQVVMVPVAEPYDIVLTTNSGYPLDINLYQAVKGMSCAAQIVRPGGSIVIAAECREGIPDYGEYRRLVQEGGSVQGVLDLISQPGFTCQDQWEAQLQARIQQVADVHVYSSGLTDEQIRDMLLTPCHRIEETLATLRAKYGPQARICVIPEGPQTIPYLTTA